MMDLLLAHMAEKKTVLRMDIAAIIVRAGHRDVSMTLSDVYPASVQRLVRRGSDYVGAGPTVLNGDELRAYQDWGKIGLIAVRWRTTSPEYRKRARTRSCTAGCAEGCVPRLSSSYTLKKSLSAGRAGKRQGHGPRRHER